MRQHQSMDDPEVRREAVKQANQHKNPTVPRELQKFTSLQSMMEFANGPCDLSVGEQASRRQAWGGFNDFPTWDAAMKAGREGWPEGTKRIKELAASLTDKVIAQVRLPELVHHDNGLNLDIERYREGDPECLMRWQDSDEVATGQGDIRIAMNVCCSAGVDSEVLQARGAAVIALTQALELVGKRVELVVIANTANAFETHFTAKAIGEPIQIDQLAFSAGSADMFRRFMFACWERGPAATRQKAGVPHNGYGRVCNAHHVDGFDLVLPTMGGWGEKDVWKDPKSAEKWVLSKLVELGVQLEGGQE